MRQLLAISSVPLALEYNIKRASLNIEQPRAELNIETDIPKPDITSDPIKISIDHTATNESLDYYKPVALAKKNAQEGMQAAAEATANICIQGRQMMESLGAAWPDIAMRRGNFHGMEDLETVFIPARPEISWHGTGQVSVKWSDPRRDIRVTPHTKANITYNPYNVDVGVKRWNDVQISYQGTTSDLYKLNSEAMHKLNLKV